MVDVPYRPDCSVVAENSVIDAPAVLWINPQLCPVHTLTIYCLVCIMVKWLRSLFHPNIFRFDIKYFQSFINLLWATGDRKINIYKLNNIMLQYFCTRHSLSAPNVYCTCAHLFKLQMAQLHTYIPHLLIIGPWPWSVHGGDGEKTM